MDGDDAPSTSNGAIGLLEGLHARPPAGMKHCPHCQRMRAKAEFGPDIRTADGLQKGCKACMRERRAKHPDQAIGDAPKRVIDDAPVAVVAEKAPASTPAKLQHKVFMVLEDACGLSREERGALVRMLIAFDQ